jgi:hypothetical protein
MERHRDSERLDKQDDSLDFSEDILDRLRSAEQMSPRQKLETFERIAEKHEKKLRDKSRTRKFIGGLLVLLGIGTVTTACPFYALAFIGSETIIAGLLMLIIGVGLFFLRPKLKQTHQAMLVAARHDNELTVPRLALEMDISFKKAEEIIKELVANDIAEMDIESRAADDALVYKIKGL